jgi:hypothetical protein
LPAKAGSDLCFFENKDLSALDLSEDVVISGIPCLRDTRVWFHNSGGLAGCTLSGDIDIKGMKYMKKSLLVFREAGSVIHVKDGTA